MERYTEVCGDNRFELIKKYKERLVAATNIETAIDEMNVIDSILFRFWQMGWLDRLEADVVPRNEVEVIEEERDRYKKYYFRHEYDKWEAEIKQEGYKEIFEEIKKLLDTYSSSRCLQGDTYVECWFDKELETAIAELEKKKIGDTQ